MSALLVILVALPALGGLIATATPAGAGERAGRIATALAGAAFVVAVLVMVAVLADGPLSAVLERGDGRAVGGLFGDRLGGVLALLVCGVSGVVQAFARRYLRGDPRAARFFAATGLLTAATLALVLSATLIGLAVAWTLAGVALCLLLGLYGDLEAARDGVRRTVRAFAIGDLALWLAVAVALVSWGNLDLRNLAAQAPTLIDDQLPLTVVAVGLVVAALARSAQLPLGGWLPATLAAPTPVSALLHAGVVNAGGVLLVKLAPLFGASGVATHLAFAAGAATALYGTALMLAKPDVKGALAHSTMGQMGFMIMTCGLGAYAAVIFHLVAHGMYKATLFLGSGAAVGGHVRHVKAPPAVPPAAGLRAAMIAVAVVVPAIAVLGAALLIGPKLEGQAGTEALLAFAWVSAAWASWGWLRRHPSLGGVLVAAGGTVVAALAYVAALRLAGELLAPSVENVARSVVDPLWLAVPVALLAAVAAARALGGRRLGELPATLYVLALSAGDAAPRRSPRPRSAGRRPHAPAGLSVRAEGAGS